MDVNSLTVKQILCYLKQNDDPDLINFILGLLRHIKEINCSPSVQQPELKIKEKLVLDKLARLLVGNEKCVAIAMSNDKLLVSSNKCQVGRDTTVELRLGYEILGFANDGSNFRFNLRVILTNLKSKVSKDKEFGPVTYTFFLHEMKKMYRPHEKEFEIQFSKTDLEDLLILHSIPMTPKGPNASDQISNYKYKIGLHNVEFNVMFDLVKHTRVETRVQGRRQHEYRPIVVYHVQWNLNKLLERTRFLLTHLVELAMSNNNVDGGGQSHRFVHENYLVNKKPIGDTREVWWPHFLNQSLTLELQGDSNDYNCFDNITVHRSIFATICGDPKCEFLPFYMKMMDDFRQYKIKNDYDTCYWTIGQWFPEFSNRECPQLIKKRELFFDKLRQYIVDLYEIEQFIERDAREGGDFTEKLIQLFTRGPEINMMVVSSTGNDKDDDDGSSFKEGVGTVHAEMSLLQYHLKNPDFELGTYYGITLASCAWCTVILEKTKLVDFRASHGTLQGGYKLGEELKAECNLQQILSTDLYSTFQKFSSEQVGGKLFNLHGDHNFKKSDIALRIIDRLSDYNNKDKIIGLLNKLGNYCPKKYLEYLIDSAKDKYKEFKLHLEDDEGGQWTLKGQTEKYNFFYHLQPRDMEELVVSQMYSLTGLKLIREPQRLGAIFKEFRMKAGQSAKEEILTLIINLGSCHWVTLVLWGRTTFSGVYMDCFRQPMPVYISEDLLANFNIETKLEGKLTPLILNSEFDAYWMTLVVFRERQSPIEETIVSDSVALDGGIKIVIPQRITIKQMYDESLTTFRYDRERKYLECRLTRLFFFSVTTDVVCIGWDELTHYLTSTQLNSLFDRLERAKSYVEWEHADKLRDLIRTRWLFNFSNHNSGFLALEYATWFNWMAQTGSCFEPSVPLPLETTSDFLKVYGHKFGDMISKTPMNEAYFQWCRKRFAEGSFF